MQQAPIKLYPPVKRQLASGLQFLFENKSASSKVINYCFKQNKKWGSRDRRSFAEAFYTLVRHLGFYLSLINKGSFENLSEDDILEMIGHFQEGKVPESNQKMLELSVSPDLKELLDKEMTVEEKESFLSQSSQTASVFLRVNFNQTSEKACIEALAKEDIQVEKIKEGCLELAERKNVFNSKAFKAGLFEIQDGASQDVAYFMQLEKGMRVADSCAGAGGKSLHMSSLMKNTGTLVSMDIFPRRLEELKKRAKRAKCHNIEIKEITGTKVVKRMEGQFDRLLLDVPCTGTGTYRRKPEAKLFFSHGEHQRLLGIQQEILQLHSRLLKPGGKMVYATCSVLPSENRKQVDAFLEKNPNFEFEEESLNAVGENNFDGFYMARLKKKN